MDFGRFGYTIVGSSTVANALSWCGERITMEAMHLCRQGYVGTLCFPLNCPINLKLLQKIVKNKSKELKKKKADQQSLAISLSLSKPQTDFFLPQGPSPPTYSSPLQKPHSTLTRGPPLHFSWCFYFRKLITANYFSTSLRWKSF